MNEIAGKVREIYSAAAAQPGAKYPFPVGASFAESLGYARPLLDAHPCAAEAFSGVACIPAFAELDQASMVLDAGCGAGLDSIAAKPRVRRVFGVDFSPEMLDRASKSAPVVRANAEELPFAPGTFDAVLANGIFNLNPGRASIMAELARVLKPGGKLWGAELILTGPQPEATLDNWFA